MTQKEAIASYEKLYAYMVGDDDVIELDYGEFMELNQYIRTALRPVSREQVEKVWSGCEACKNAGLAIGEVQFYGPFEGSIDVSGNMQYCPNCGRPITPAAKEEQLERMEALKDAGD